MPKNLPLPNLASKLRRLAAFLIDGAFFSVAIPVQLEKKELLAAGLSEQAASTVTTIAIVFILILVGLNAFLIIRRSQTIGKFLLNIQVINKKTQQRTGFWRYFLLRTLIGQNLGLLLGILLPIILFAFFPDLLFWGMLMLIGQLAYPLIDSLFIFRKDQRTLHDLIAGTSVINLPPNEKRKTCFDWSVLPK